MSLGEVAAGLLILGMSVKPVKAYVPFSLFDFNYIKKFNVDCKVLEAAAGVAIGNTTFYTCPEHKFALLLNLHVIVSKTTATALTVRIVRKTLDEIVDTSQALIKEDANTGYYAWPSGKATGAHVFGWHLCFLFPGDILDLGHALTAAETITDTVSWIIIEYDDPRYKE